MYESYWQFTQKPFENVDGDSFYFPSESHQGALLKLRYAIENFRGGALLSGGAGLGKTLLAEILAKALDDSFGPFAHAVFPQMPTSQLLHYLADELAGPNSAVGEGNVATSVRRIERFLTENAKAGRHAVLVIDEAHLIDNTESLEAIRLLLNYSVNGRAAMTLLLVGQTSILPVLKRMPQLEERLAVKCLLRPFTEQETSDYVAHRLKAAGAKRSIFEPDAMRTLHELTHGVARQINRLCDLALLIGFAEERQTLSATNLESVCRELVDVVPE